ncbi:hypothetical protein D3C75_1002260 [compost metagenome]
MMSVLQIHIPNNGVRSVRCHPEAFLADKQAFFCGGQLLVLAPQHFLGGLQIVVQHLELHIAGGKLPAHLPGLPDMQQKKQDKTHQRRKRP